MDDLTQVIIHSPSLFYIPISCLLLWLINCHPAKIPEGATKTGTGGMAHAGAEHCGVG